MDPAPNTPPVSPSPAPMPAPAPSKGMGKATIAIALIAVAALLGVYYFLQQGSMPLAQTTPTPSPTASQAPGLTIAQVKNAAYYDFNEPLFGKATVQLQDGKYIKEEISKGKGGEDVVNRVEVSIYEDKMATGDLDGDGNADAAVILTSRFGGTGSFRELAILKNDKGTPVYVTKADLGDRIIVKSVVIQGGNITLDMVVQGPGDGLCCPSLPKKAEYRLTGNKLEQIASSDIKDWKTYTNAKYGFGVKYPNGWTLSESKSPGAPYLMFANLGKDEHFEGGGVIFLGVRNQTTEEYFASLNKDGTKFVEESKVTLDGTSAVRGRLERDQYKDQKVVLVSKNGYLYELSVSPASSYENTFNQILSTFKFTK